MYGAGKLTRQTDYCRQLQH